MDFILVGAKSAHAGACSLLSKNITIKQDRLTDNADRDNSWLEKAEIKRSQHGQ
jgi:hypothetical protein